MGQDNLSILADRSKALAEQWNQPANTTSPKSLDDLAEGTLAAIEAQRANDFALRRQRMQQPISSKPGQTTAAVAQGVIGAFFKGVLSPISSFLPDAFNEKLDAWEEDAIRKQLGLMQRSQHADTYKAHPQISSALVAAPTMIGEMVGATAPFIPVYGAARKAYGVAKEATMAGKVTSSMLSGASTGGVLSVAAELEPGESRWTRVATDAAMMGAFELVGIPAMRKAVREESPILADTLASKMGLTHDVVESELTAIRSGVPANPAVVDEVLNTAKIIPELQTHPIVLQAAKQKEAEARLIHPNTTVDPFLVTEDPTLAARITATVEGKQVITDIRKDPTNLSHFRKNSKAYIDDIRDMVSKGLDVRVHSITTGTMEDADEILVALQGKTPKTSAKGVPGAAPPNSVGLSGDIPAIGAEVTVVEPGKPVVKGVVIAEATHITASGASPERLEQLLGGIAEQQARLSKELVGAPAARAIKLRKELAMLAENKAAWERDLHAMRNGPTVAEAPVAVVEGGGKTVGRTLAGLKVEREEIARDIEKVIPGKKRDKLEKALAEIDEEIARAEGVAPAAPVAEQLKASLAARTAATPAVAEPAVVVRKSAEAKADAFALAKDGTVAVEMPDKSVRRIPLAHLQVPLAIGVPQSVTLKPHLDGTPRRAIIHLDEGRVSFESVGGSRDPSQSYFRSEVFESTTSDVQYGRDPRLYIGEGGQVSISIGRLEQQEAPTGFTRLYRGQQAATAQDIPVRHFTPSRDAAEQFAKTEAGELVYLDIPTGDLSKYAVQDPLVPFAKTGPIAEYRIPKNLAETATTTKLAGNLPFPAAINEEQIAKSRIPHPELVTAKRSAQALIKQGVDPSTKVTIRLAYGRHTETGMFSAETKARTLREWADTKLPLTNMQSLQDAAAQRGLKAVPFGSQVVLTSPNGHSRTFANSLEAHEAVLRMPTSEVKYKVEAELERQWKMGSERAYDPDVDATRFMPLEAKEKALQALSSGKLPLVPVYTRNGESVQKMVHALEAKLGVKPGTFRAVATPAMDQGEKKAMVIFNESAVALQAAKYRASLKFLNVEARTPEEMIVALSKKAKGHGIYVLSGRDGESAAIYAHWREQGMKEFWEKGRVETDILGPYRRYNKDQKGLIHYKGAGDEQYIAKDLADSFEAPAVSFAPDSGRKPRMAEEMAPFEPEVPLMKRLDEPRWSTATEEATLPSGEKIKVMSNLPPREFRDDTGPLTKFLGLRFRPMLELSKDLQAKLGVPFYDWYKGIEYGRTRVDQIINPLLAHVRDMAKPLNREQRKQVTQLFEARMLRQENLAAVEEQVGPKVKDTVDKLRQVYVDFFKTQGFEEKDVDMLFEFFPHLRKTDGDYRQALKGRSGIPKIAQLLSKDLQNGTIMIDERELDFQRIANRIMRSTVTEKELAPIWKRVETEMLAFAEARRIPKDTADVFMQYMNEVLHMPDTMQISLARAFKDVAQKVGWRMTDSDAIVSVGMFTQMNYFTNMAWNVGITMRNYLQVIQTAMPIIGVEDTVAGWKYGLKWWRDPKVQEEMVRRGVIPANSLYQPMQEVERLVDSVAGTGGKLIDAMYNKGTKWHATADEFNKVVAYHGQYTRAERFGKQYIEGKITWQQWVEASKADMRDQPGGVFIQELRAAFDSGKPEQAYHRLGEEFSKATQFVYSRGNSPYMMQSTAGRFFLQYGTWPMWYAENFKNMFTRGSSANRAKAIATWGVTQGAMFATANEVFGVDMSRWVFFSPLGYAGGPFAQLALQGSEMVRGAVDPTVNDPVNRIMSARFARGIVRQTIPLPMGAANNLIKGVQQMNDGNWSDAARQFLGLPPSTGSIMP